MEISDENFRVWAEQNEVYFDGVFRLAGPDAYAPIYSLISGLLHDGHKQVTFNLTGLEFLNSSKSPGQVDHRSQKDGRPAAGRQRHAPISLASQIPPEPQETASAS